MKKIINCSYIIGACVNQKFFNVSYKSPKCIHLLLNSWLLFVMYQIKWGKNK